MNVVGSECRSFPVLWGRPRPVGGGNPVCMAKQQPLIGATKINNPAPHIIMAEEQQVRLTLTVVVVCVLNYWMLGKKSSAHA